MRVGLAASARFHFFDLARELKKRGLLGTFVTGYPLSRVQDEGLDGHLSSAPELFAPMMLIARQGRFGAEIAEWMHPRVSRSIDLAAKARLSDCDVLIASSNCGLAAGRAAKQRGAAWLCDRGVAHIGWQDRILQEEADRWGLPRRPIQRMSVERELAEYAEADLILAPSQFVHRTFVEEGVPAEKVAVATLGADLTRFAPVAEKSSTPLFMFAGNVCLQKGVLDLMVAFRLLEPGSARLVLAGAIDPAIAPLLKYLPPGMELAGKLNRDALQRLMSESWAIVQPSIQDGFGMVAAEAMACGTPAIISQNAGACELICEGRNGWVVPARKPEALAEAMEACLSQPERTHAMGAEALRMMKAMGGWDAYGDRIAEILFGLARPPAEAQTSR